MSIVKVKDVMVPLDTYPTIHEDATLYESVMALEDAHSKESKSNYKYRALLVLDDDKHVVGKLDHLSILRALEPQFQDIGDVSMLTRFGFGPSFLRNITRDFELLQKPLDDICTKAAKITVHRIMHVPGATEFIDHETTLNEGIHTLVMGNRQSLLAKKEDRVVGILRLSDVYHYIHESMGRCEI